MRVFIATIVLLGMIGCADKGSDAKILDKEKMQAVMWDIINADVFTDQFVKKDSLKNASLENMQLQNKIFALHKVTRADYYRSYDYYLSHGDVMKVILDSMSVKGERDRGKMTHQRSLIQPK
ncbi:MAG: DUF4296 domain-containing protein [Ferruginibacter sp.]